MRITKMEITIDKMSELLNTKENEYPFSMEERQLAAQASADTWEAILNNNVQPFDFKK